MDELLMVEAYSFSDFSTSLSKIPVSRVLSLKFNLSPKFHTSPSNQFLSLELRLLPSLFHILDENDSLPSSSVTSMSAVGGYYKLTELLVLFISFWVPVDPRNHQAYVARRPSNL
ncbi:hypothetical protein DVH24_000057 [Malus domestica]|uniref:Uncharacterized protein n=1 Tax=Malus domestica TaxID=3750 RepID=A0A498IYQ5_MALDO|nr:hypothetical protein DVH24_000057 [Malus domestica]